MKCLSPCLYLSISFPKGNIQVEILFEHFIFQCMFLGKGEFWWGMRKISEFSLRVLAGSLSMYKFDNTAYKRVKGVQKGCLAHKMAMT